MSISPRWSRRRRRRLAACPFWRRWCRRRGLVDDPGQRKIHTEPIPLAGGLAVLTGLVAPLVAAVALALGHAGARDFLVRLLGHFIDSNAVGLFEYGLGKRGVPLAGIVAGAIGMWATGLPR